MMFATGKETRAETRRAGGFTLVELILVMALLVIAVSLIMPTMSKFFGGRALDSEVKRFVALIHYGRVRAVGEGVPMLLWVDTTHTNYGLRQDFAFGDDAKSVKNTVAKGLTISVSRNGVRAPIANSQTGRIQTGQVVMRRNVQPAIYFEPDGSINLALSVSGVCLQDPNHPPMWIVPNDTDAGYDLERENPNNRRR